MSIQEYFLKLPEHLKDAYIEQLHNLALIVVLNKEQYNTHLKRLVHSTATPLKLRKMYKFMLRLDWNDRERFFNAFYTE